MKELKSCPFCGGKAKISYKDYRFYGRNAFGDVKKKYRLQVICNRCRSRGAPIITAWLINPNPYALFRKDQAEMFAPYIERAVEAWNRRTGLGEEAQK